MNGAEYEVDYLSLCTKSKLWEYETSTFEERHPNCTDSTIVHGYIGLPVTIVRLLAESNCLMPQAILPLQRRKSVLSTPRWEANNVTRA